MRTSLLAIFLIVLPTTLPAIPKYWHTVGNPSFEQTALPANNFTINKQPAWEESALHGPNSFTEHIVGFNGHGVNHIGLMNGDYVYHDLDSPETDPAKIAAEESPVAGRKYSLIVAVGNRPGWTQANNVSLIRLQLVNGASVTTVAERTVNASTIPSGTFRTFNATYTATSTGPAGSKFRIWLQVLSGDRAHFDDVQLISSVPFNLGDQHTQIPPYPQPTIPFLNSAPGYSKVLYLDFDGESNFPAMAEWNGGEPLPTLAHSGLSTLEIQRAFEVVKDDFSPFPINVTTDPARYWAAAPGSRMRVIITPTNTWNYRELGPEAGNSGQAPWRPWLFALDALGANLAYAAAQNSGITFHREVPTFVWTTAWLGPAYPFGSILDDNGRQIGHWISHEVGHSFGLLHDGIASDAYYNGNGPDVTMKNRIGQANTQSGKLWAPIMGDAGYLTQWSKGEYANATNDGLALQDDVAILGAALGFVTDGNETYGTATPLTLSGSSFAASGVMSKTASGGAEVDYYRITLAAPATLQVVFKPAEPLYDPDPLVAQGLNSGVPSLRLAAELFRSNQSFCCQGNYGASTPVVPSAPNSTQERNPTEFLRVYLNATLQPGTHYIKVTAPGYNNPATNGFSSHGNMGQYSFSGDLTYTAPQITSPVQASGLVGSFFSYTAQCDQSPVTWSATNRPAWLGINATTGVLSGTPTAGGTFVVRLQANNGVVIGTEELTITIGVPAAPTITSPTAHSGEEGQFLSVPIIANGGATSYGIAGGAVPGLGVHPSTGVISGTPTTPGVISMTVTASNAFGTGMLSIPFTIRPSPQTALDTTALAFTRADLKNWFGEMTNTWDGVDAMQSPPLNDNESSTIETTVSGPGTISYYWKADTEAGDVLSLRIGTNPVDTVSGATGWLFRSHSVPAGVQTLRWTFSRNVSGSGGSNSVWLDRVIWSAATGPTITNSLGVSWTCGRIATVNLTSDDPSTVWSMSGTLPGGVFFVPSPSNVIGAIATRPGTFSITLFATNALGTTTRAFTMYIESSYAYWARNNGLGVGSETGDPDQDGITNFAELALGLDPLVRNANYQPVSYDPATKRLRAVFRRRHQYYPDIKYEVQASENLQTWTTIAQVTDGQSLTNLGSQTLTEAQIQPHPDPIYEVTAIDAIAQSPAKPKRWMRVKVSQQQ